MARLLMLAHRPPNPPDKGDKIRSHHVLRHLCSRHEVWLGCLVDTPEDVAHVEALRPRVARLAWARVDGVARRAWSLRALWPARSITVTHFHRASLQAQVDSWLDEATFDAVLCYSSPMAEYVFRSRHVGGRLARARRVMDMIDVDSAKWAQYAREAPAWQAWIYRHEAAALAAYERRIVEGFDRTFLVSRAEASLLGGHPRVDAFPNGVDLEYFAPSARTLQAPPSAVFTGVMDYRPNIDAVDWFAREILPLARRSIPDLRFVIVGARPTATVRNLASLPGVEVTGRVPDVRTYVAPATVCVAPLRIARGLQNKVLEAMAMGKPTVATPQAFEGIDAAAGRDVRVEQTAEAFAAAVVSLVRSPQEAARLGAHARAAVERAYRWDHALEPLERALRVAAEAEAQAVLQ